VLTLVWASAGNYVIYLSPACNVVSGNEMTWTLSRLQLASRHSLPTDVTIMTGWMQLRLKEGSEERSRPSSLTSMQLARDALRQSEMVLAASYLSTKIFEVPFVHLPSMIIRHSVLHARYVAARRPTERQCASRKLHLWMNYCQSSSLPVRELGAGPPGPAAAALQQWTRMRRRWSGRNILGSGTIPQRHSIRQRRITPPITKIKRNIAARNCLIASFTAQFLGYWMSTSMRSSTNGYYLTKPGDWTT
jgi:hypothetical protein